MKNGYYIRWWDSDIKESEGLYKDGNKIGEWKFWDINGVTITQ